LSKRGWTLTRGVEAFENLKLPLQQAFEECVQCIAAGVPWKTISMSLTREMVVDVASRSLLSGRKGLVVGIANEHSIAYGCARMFHDCGAQLAVTWINEKTRGYVEPLARELAAPITMPLDVGKPGEMEAVFDAIRERWGHLDFLLHSIASAPAQDLRGRVADTSR